ncbi:MAG: FMN-binding protein [Desulfovibrionaceae bacterium]
MFDIIKMIVVLSSICGIAGFGLAYLKQSTAPRIEEQVMTYVQGPAILKVFQDLENSPIAERKKFTLPEGGTVTVFPAKRGGKLVGIAIENFGKGFGGDVGIMVGFDTGRDTLVGIGITTMKETPGIGSMIASPNFIGQFTGKPLNIRLKSQGGTIDAVSGATVSSTGALTAVSNAAKVYTTLKPQIVQQWPQGE